MKYSIERYYSRRSKAKNLGSKIQACITSSPIIISSGLYLGLTNCLKQPLQSQHCSETLNCTKHHVRGDQTHVTWAKKMATTIRPHCQGLFLFFDMETGDKKEKETENVSFQFSLVQPEKKFSKKLVSFSKMFFFAFYSISIGCH